MLVRDSANQQKGGEMTKAGGGHPVVCGQCPHATTVLLWGEPWMLLCRNLASDHYGHIVAKDHPACSAIREKENDN